MVPVEIYQTQYSGTPLDQRSVGVAVSSTNTYYSQPWSSRFGATFALMVEWTGTPTGTLTLWWSNKIAPNLANDTDWIQETTYTPTNPAGSASKDGKLLSIVPARWFRLKYVNASGSGTLTGQVHSTSV